MNAFKTFALIIAIITSPLWEGPGFAKEPATEKTTKEAPPASRNTGASPPQPTVGSLIAPPILEDERPGNKMIKNAFRKKDRSGAGNHFKGKKLVEISQRMVAWKALEKNLSIHMQSISEDIAKAALLEAKAVFYPVFDFDVSYTEKDTSDRHLWGKQRLEEIKFRRPIKEFPSQSPVLEMHFADIREEKVVERDIYASQDEPGQSTDSGSFSIGISQQLPWGPSLNITTVSNYLQSPYDELGHTYGGPWASNISATLSLPLPYTMYFGPYAITDVNIKLSDISKDRAFWDVKSTINSTLLNVDHAYWEVVRTLKNLEVTIENRKGVKKLVDHTQELFDVKRTTAYGQSMVGAEFERVRALEEAAWNAFIVASNALTFILDSKKDTIYLPIGYSAALQEALSFNPEESIAIGMENRPELKSSQTYLGYRKIREKESETRTRPDLNFSGTGKLSQSNREYGYRSLGKSLHNLFNEDSKSQTYKLSYNYPFRNRALKAAYSQARTSVEDQENDVRQVENRIAREINNALSSVFSSRTRTKIAKENVRLAKMAFEDAENLRKANRLTEFEIMRKSSDLLAANYSLINAQIQSKKSESLLLHAEGILPSRYPKITARNEFERYRVGLLSANKVLRYFQPVKK